MVHTSQIIMIKTASVKIFIVIAIFITGVYGCRTPRSVVPEVKPLSSADLTLAEVHANKADFEWMSTRFSGTVKWEDRTHAIAGSMKVRKDSAIYISLAPFLGIEVARAIITRDSVKLINRLESTYYIGNHNFLSKMFNAEMDFFMLQALLLGDDFPHFRNDQFLMQANSPLIKLHAQKRTRKIGDENAIEQILSIDPESMQIRTNIIEQTTTGRALRADYKKYDMIQGQSLPTDLQLMFADKGNVNSSNLELFFTRTTLNVPQSMQFSVPDKYTPIRLND